MLLFPRMPPISHPPFDLAAAARSEMIHDGFRLPIPSPESIAQLAAIRGRLATPDPTCKDLRTLLWSSIDNDTSRDLDQAEYAEQTPAGIRVLVAIADVAAAVAKDSPLDRDAAAQTQTIYTAVHNFPMLPLELSTDLTSLNEGHDRAALVIEFTVDSAGLPTQPAIYAANICNHAQLAYSTTGAWLESKPRADGRFEPQLIAHADLSPPSFACRTRPPSACTPSASSWARSTSSALKPTPSSSTARSSPSRPCSRTAPPTSSQTS